MGKLKFFATLVSVGFLVWSIRYMILSYLPAYYRDTSIVFSVLTAIAVGFIFLSRLKFLSMSAYWSIIPFSAPLFTPSNYFDIGYGIAPLLSTLVFPFYGVLYIGLLLFLLFKKAGL